MSEEKICPMLAQGWIAGFLTKTIRHIPDIRINSVGFHKALPKCLKENCALWIRANMSNCIDEKSRDAHCGLID